MSSDLGQKFTSTCALLHFCTFTLLTLLHFCSFFVSYIALDRDLLHLYQFPTNTNTYIHTHTHTHTQTPSPPPLTLPHHRSTLVPPGAVRDSDYSRGNAYMYCVQVRQRCTAFRSPIFCRIMWSECFRIRSEPSFISLVCNTNHTH